MKCESYSDKSHAQMLMLEKYLTFFTLQSRQRSKIGVFRKLFQNRVCQLQVISSQNNHIFCKYLQFALGQYHLR